MRNKKLIKTAVCGAILSASLMVSQQNIYAAQEENIINAETGEKEASQNVPEPGAEQDIIKDEEQPPDPNPDSDAAEDPDEKRRMRIPLLTNQHLKSPRMRTIRLFL